MDQRAQKVQGVQDVENVEVVESVDLTLLTLQGRRPILHFEHVLQITRDLSTHPAFRERLDSVEMTRL